MKTLLLVALGGALGSVGRHLLTVLLAPSLPRFPLGTLLANVLGSFFIGMVYAWSKTEPPAVSPAAALFLMTGVLGGFTTFSAFSLQTLQLIQQSEWTSALLNIFASVVLCLGAVWLGAAAVTRLSG